MYKRLYFFIFILQIASASYAKSQVDSGYSDSEMEVIRELKNGADYSDPSSSDALTDEEEKKAKKALEVLKDTKRTFNPSFQKKGSLNENLSVFRDNEQVLSVAMSTNDVVDTNICFQSPVRILLGSSISDVINQAVIDDPTSIDAKVLKDERSVFIMMKKEMKKEGRVYRTRVRIIRKSDNRSYIVNLNAQACPSSGRLGFPSEVILEEKSQSASSENSKLKTPEDLIIDLTDGYPRKNHENQIEVYGGLMSSGSDYSMIAFNVKIGNTTRDKFYPQFYVLDSLQTKVIGMQDPVFLEKESKAVSDRVKHPILRFNLFIKANKKYIIERDSVYLIMVEHGERYYQKIKIPMSALREKLINQGMDLN